jgi:hypothetical protein
LACAFTDPPLRLSFAALGAALACAAAALLRAGGFLLAFFALLGVIFCAMSFSLYIRVQIRNPPRNRAVPTDRRKDPNPPPAAHPRGKSPANPSPLAANDHPRPSRRVCHPPFAWHRAAGKFASLAVVHSRCVRAETTPKYHNTIFTDLEAGGECFSLVSLAKCLSSSDTQQQLFTQP